MICDRPWKVFIFLVIFFVKSHAQEVMPRCCHDQHNPPVAGDTTTAPPHNQHNPMGGDTTTAPPHNQHNPMGGDTTTAPPHNQHNPMGGDTTTASPHNSHMGGVTPTGHAHTTQPSHGMGHTQTTQASHGNVHAQTTKPSHGMDHALTTQQQQGEASNQTESSTHLPNKSVTPIDQHTTTTAVPTIDDVIDGPPRLIPHPAISAVENGTTLRIACSVENFAFPHFAWTDVNERRVIFNDGEMNTRSDDSGEKYRRFEVREWRTGAGGFSTLVIRDVEIVHEGVYRCQVVGLHVDEPADTLVKVEVKSDVSINLNGLLWAGLSHTVYCNAIGGRPREHITWYIDGVAQREGVVETHSRNANDDLYNTESAYTFVAHPGLDGAEIACQVNGHRIAGMNQRVAETGILVLNNTFWQPTTTDDPVNEVEEEISKLKDENYNLKTAAGLLGALFALSFVANVIQTLMCCPMDVLCKCCQCCDSAGKYTDTLLDESMKRKPDLNKNGIINEALEMDDPDKEMPEWNSKHFKFPFAKIAWLSQIGPVGKGSFGQVWKAEITIDRRKSFADVATLVVKQIRARTNGDSMQSSEEEDKSGSGMPVAIRKLPGSEQDMGSEVSVENSLIMKGRVMESAKQLKSLLRLSKMPPHRYVVKCLGTCPEMPSLMYEYVPNGSLLTYLRSNNVYNSVVFGGIEKIQKFGILSADKLMQFAFQIANGLKFLHDHDIIHGRLCAHNILLTYTKDCKISDYGLSSLIRQDKTITRWESPETMVYNIRDRQSDVFSFGILMWEIITTGKLPYPGFSLEKVKEQVTQGYKMARPSHCAQALYSVMISCWDIKPNKRATASLLAEKLDIMSAKAKNYLKMDILEKEVKEEFSCALNPSMSIDVTMATTSSDSESSESST